MTHIIIYGAIFMLRFRSQGNLFSSYGLFLEMSFSPGHDRDLAQ